MKPCSFNRRQFLAATFTALAASRSLASALAETPLGIQPKGIFIRDCTIRGDTRADDVFPAHPNGTRLSQNRFLILYATRSWRGTDDDLSVIYQIRANDYDGPLLKEGRLAAATDDWNLFDDGRRYKMSHGHPTAFGVPKGALIGGRSAPHANVFVAKWYKYAREFLAPDVVRSGVETEDLSYRSGQVEWVQFRLNEAEDDLEILQTPQTLYRPGADPTDLIGSRLGTNQSYCNPQPFNPDATEWIDLFNFPVKTDNHRLLSAVKFRFDSATRRYVCAEVGPTLFDPQLGAHEPSLVRLSDGDWAIFGRVLHSPALWLHTSDPFGKRPGRIHLSRGEGQPTVIAPVTIYRCADGTIRFLSGDKQASPYEKPRDPLYMWDVDPKRDFQLTSRRLVFSGRATLPQVRPEAYVMADMAKILPHAGGKSQLLLHRVRTWAINHEIENKGPALLPHEKTVQGIYSARLNYDQAYPDLWSFGSS